MPDPTDPLAPYAEAVARHGAGFEATLWGSPETQRLRFSVMARLADLDGARVLDLGCGPGELAAWMGEQGIDHAGYVGIDGLEAMVTEARARGLPRAEFRVADLLADARAFEPGSYDWACLSGTLNTMTDADAWGLVRRAWDGARRGVVLNVLSDRPGAAWRDKPLGPARRTDVLAWLDRALALTPRVRFDQAYLDGHDATLALERPGPGG